jgi:hypothetical protein
MDNIPIGSDAYIFADSILVKKNKWYTLTYTYDRNTAKMYIDANLKIPGRFL